MTTTTETTRPEPPVDMAMPPSPPPIRARERRMMTRPQILLRARRWERQADALALIVAGLHWWQGRARRWEMRQAEREIRARADELRHVLGGYGMAKAEKGEQK